MSNIKEIIEIVPPRGVIGHKKVLKSKPCKCPVCYGAGGWHYSEHDPRYEEVGTFKRCQTCEGSGRVRAKITIEWEADIPEVNKTIA